jgi:hypothetical protein
MLTRAASGRRRAVSLWTTRGQGASGAGRAPDGVALSENLETARPGTCRRRSRCATRYRVTHKRAGIETLLANCLAHGRRQFVEVADNFPEDCRYVLETLGGVYHHDALPREQQLSPEDLLRFHQEHSGPLMQGLYGWMEAQLAEHKTGRAHRQQHRGAYPEESHPEPQERALLQHVERRRSR